jgi:hypothetical protein
MLLNDAKAKLSSETSLAEFIKWAALNLSMVSPMLVLQIKFRKRLLGEKFWVNMMERRYQIPEQIKPDFSKKIQLSIAKINAETKEKKIRHDKDKIVEVKASLSASQKNIQAKETAVLQSLMRANSSIAPLAPSPSSRKLDISTGDGEDNELESPVATAKKTKKLRPTSASASSRQNTTTRPGSAKSRPTSAKKNISFKDESAATATGKSSKEDRRKTKKEKQ